MDLNLNINDKSSIKSISMYESDVKDAMYIGKGTTKGIRLALKFTREAMKRAKTKDLNKILEKLSSDS